MGWPFGSDEDDEKLQQKADMKAASWLFRKWRENRKRKAEETARENERRRRDTEEAVRKSLGEDEDS